MWAIGEPSGPIENGTTYIVRPSMQPSNSSLSVSRISAGSRQLLVGPASSSRSEQMKVRSSTRATSRGIGESEVGVGALGVGEPLEGARVHQPLRQAVVLLGRAVAPVHLVGLGQRGDLLHPGLQLLVLGGDGALAHGFGSLLGSLAPVGKGRDGSAPRPAESAHPSPHRPGSGRPGRPGHRPRPPSGLIVESRPSGGGSETPAPAGTSAGWCCGSCSGSGPAGTWSGRPSSATWPDPARRRTRRPGRWPSR